ncbi:MAG: maleylpyruvate isomerase family mycothiol-dependent enzyme [Actinomycetota bacterium]
MKRKEVLGAAQDERMRLVGDLRSLDWGQWDAPTLCEGWTVRDVVGHLIRLDAYTHRIDRFLLSVVRSRGLNRFMSKDAVEWAAGRSPDELIATLATARYETRIVERYNIWPVFPLVELVIHGQDIRRPLGMDGRLSLEVLLEVADHLRRSYLRPWGEGTKVKGVRFVASDADWSMGKGPEVRGPLEAIVMTLAGRPSAVAELSGEGQDLLLS